MRMLLRGENDSKQSDEFQASLLSVLVGSCGQSHTPFLADISILILLFNVVTLILFFPRIDSFRAASYFKDCRMLLATIR